MQAGVVRQLASCRFNKRPHKAHRLSTVHASWHRLRLSRARPAYFQPAAIESINNALSQSPWLQMANNQSGTCDGGMGGTVQV
jgi:hypothetical protein